MKYRPLVVVAGLFLGGCQQVHHLLGDRSHDGVEKPLVLLIAGQSNAECIVDAPDSYSVTGRVTINKKVYDKKALKDVGM